MYIEILTLSIIIDIDRQHWKSCTAVATFEWHTVKICKHSHNRLIDNIGDYLYFKNQRMEASNLKLIHISSTWDCTTFHNFLPMFQQKKKDFQKLAGLWLADEVVNHVGIYGSKAAEGLSAFQRRSCYTWYPLCWPFSYQSDWLLIAWFVVLRQRVWSQLCTRDKSLLCFHCALHFFIYHIYEFRKYKNRMNFPGCIYWIVYTFLLYLTQVPLWYAV